MNPRVPGNTETAGPAITPRTPESGRRVRSVGFWAATTLGAVAVALLLAVDVFPIITNDGLDYLRHSNALGETGVIQYGYRQFGYPLFLATVDAFGSAVRLEPLLGAAVLQRLVYLAALGFSVWLWRWRAVPLIALAIIPTLIAYTNFILTEGLAVGLALWYAALVALALRPSANVRDRSGAFEKPERLLVATGIVVAIVYLSLVAIRFHYLLLGFGVLAVLYAMFRAGGIARKGAIALVVALLVVWSGLLVALSSENSHEYGTFSPSAAGGRSQYWAAWQVVFRLEPDNTANSALAEFYTGGDVWVVPRRLDSLRPYADQLAAYAEARDRLIDESGKSWWAERSRSFLGVLQGGRLDDVEAIVEDAARADFDTVPDVIYRNSIAREDGVTPFLDLYNDGRRIQPILISPAAPVRRAPYFGSILRWMLPAAAIVLFAGLALRRSRLLSIVGVASLLTTATVFGFFLMDNVRFLIVQSMFVVAIATGVVDHGWRYVRRRSLIDSKPNVDLPPNPNLADEPRGPGG